MNRHAGPPAGSAPEVATPTYAESARTLAHLGQTGTLATLSRKHPGHPFASVMPYALDEQGQPVVLISAMAMHTQNVAADARASLLVAQPTAGDPLAAARLTLMGAAQRVSDADRGAVRAAYLARHPNAAYWVEFDDFSFWRLQVLDVYFVGGFGAMGWVVASEYLAARPDPLADSSEALLEHVNGAQGGELLAYARTITGQALDEARMVAMDRLGFKLRLRAGDRVHALRVAFPREVLSDADCRQVLAGLLRA